MASGTGEADGAAGATGTVEAAGGAEAAGAVAPAGGTGGLGDGTRCVQAGLAHPQPGQPFLPGPVFAATFPLDPRTGPVPGTPSYGRRDSTTRANLEAAIGELETGECLVFASGMAAISAALLSLPRPGDQVILPADGYYQTRSFAVPALAERGIAVSLAPTGPVPDLDGVALLMLETPSNPNLDVCDIAELAAAAHRAGTLVVVDNTTATPLGQSPLALGADLVVASATKALSGHSDLLLGYVATRDAALLARLRAFRDATGGVPSNFDAWLAHRSLATLDLRLARQSANAAALASMLAQHPRVVSVRWPGLPADPSYVVAARQMRRLPGVLTFTLAGAAQVERLLLSTRLVTAATSFGGLHTTADRRAQWGDNAPEGLVRLSCGIEDTADLVADLRQVLDSLEPDPLE